MKVFEIILEQSGKLLNMAAKHSLIGLDEAERWMKYRDNRNDMAHDYGEDFANETLALMLCCLS